MQSQTSQTQNLICHASESWHPGVLNKFDWNKHYAVFDTNIEKKNQEKYRAILLKYPGIKLIHQYYQKKYQTNIILVSQREFPFSELQQCRLNGKSVFRQVWILGVEDDHAIPIIYLKEDNQEILFYANSQGCNPSGLEKYLQSTNLIIYAVDRIRQFDSFSCFTDALLFGRDITAIDKTTQQYRISNLLEKLKIKAVKISNRIYCTELPEELLKTNQSLLDLKSTDTKVHKNENIKQFRERYELHNVILGMKGEQPKVSDYLRQKGLKLINILEIQFYLNQLDLKDTGEFVKQGKEILKQDTLDNKRKGLYEYASTFWGKTKNAVVVPVDSKSEITFLNKK